MSKGQRNNQSADGEKLTATKSVENLTVDIPLSLPDNLTEPSKLTVDAPPDVPTKYEFCYVYTFIYPRFCLSLFSFLNLVIK